MKKLDVVFCGWGQRWTLGTLAQGGRHIVFEYSEEALRRGVRCSELSVPLRAQAYSDFPQHFSGLPGFVADALPDGWGLLLMDRVFRKSGRDPATLSPLDRLAFVGDRAMGALTFRPASDLDLSREDMTLQELASAASEVVEDRETRALATLALVGGSPHGARPKALVQFDPARGVVSTDPDGSGAPWLVKFPARGEHIEVCGIEYAYAQLAGAVGLDMPKTKLFDLGPRLAAFGVARFDRQNGMRVPVQSFAAALHADFRIPSLDYESVLLATRFLSGSQMQMRTAFDRCVFNVLFNNRDDHAKNMALRMNSRMQWELAPGYDLTYCAGPGGYHQTSVMGEARSPGREHLIALAMKCDVPGSYASHTIESMSDSARQLDALMDAAGVRKATRRSIANAVAQNVRRCMLPTVPVRARDERVKQGDSGSRHSRER